MNNRDYKIYPAFIGTSFVRLIQQHSSKELRICRNWT